MPEPATPPTWPEGLIPFHPRVELTATCPVTGQALRAVDWVMPGMWTLAKVESEDGKLTYWMDFPYSAGLLTASFLKIDTGETFSAPTCLWYVNALKQMWLDRKPVPVTLRVKKFRECRRPVFLNCMSAWYGDSVNMLLRANALQRQNYDVIALIPPSLGRLLPDYLAEAWIVESDCWPGHWNEALTPAIKQELARFEVAYIPRSFKPAVLDQKSLEEISGITPFPRNKWTDRMLEKPVVTFFLREDRSWVPDGNKASLLYRSLRGPLKRFRAGLAKWELRRDARRQEKQITALARCLREISPKLEFAVCGLKGESQFPDTIKDVRATKMGRETNQLWDEQCSRSHVVVCVHGSHTMPHNGFAGSYVELVPHDRWSNLLTTPFVTTTDTRETLFCYRFLPIAIDPEELANIILSVIYNYPSARCAYSNDFPDPISDANYAKFMADQQKRFRAVDECSPKLRRLLSP